MGHESKKELSEDRDDWIRAWGKAKKELYALETSTGTEIEYWKDQYNHLREIYKDRLDKYDQLVDKLETILREVKQ